MDRFEWLSISYNKGVFKYFFYTVQEGKLKLHQLILRISRVVFLSVKDHGDRNKFWEDMAPDLEYLDVDNFYIFSLTTERAT